MLKRKYRSGAEKRKAKKVKEESVKNLPSVADFYKRSIVEDQSNQIEIGGKSDSVKDDSAIDTPSNINPKPSIAQTEDKDRLNQVLMCEESDSVAETGIIGALNCSKRGISNGFERKYN